jgi:hypothetical protein
MEIKTHPERNTWIIEGTLFGQPAIIFEGSLFDAICFRANYS